MHSRNAANVTLARRLAKAVLHHRAGRLGQAAALYRDILRAHPANADALNLLGTAAAQQGQPETALELIGQALVAAPDFVDAHLNLGNALRALGRHDEAAASIRRAIELRPNFSAAHVNLGRILAEQGRAAEACGALRHALACRPADTAHLRDMAQLFADLHALDDAQACLDMALAQRPDSIDLLRLRADMLFRRGRIGEAIEAYQAAGAAAPGAAEVWNGFGRALRAAGRFDEARSCFRRALSIAPTFADAHRNLGLTGATGPVPFDELARLFASPDRPVADRVAAGFALGRALDEADRITEAFAAYAAANALLRGARAAQGQVFDADAFDRQVDSLIATSVPMPRWTEHPTATARQAPVFIVGMPRSGTSLVEQIAASHSRVFGAGERRDIGGIAEAWRDGTTTGDVDGSRAAQMADAYREHLHRLAPDALRVIDKMPDNILHLGTIAALFPHAYVIFCRRDPRDTCLSCFFTLFGQGNLFSTDLDDCARRHRATDRLAAHWQAVLTLPMIEVQYESVVQDLEGEARRVIAFLGLSWEPACLDFHRTDRHVVTASSWQVRQPLYAHAVGRWRRFGRPA